MKPKTKGKVLLVDDDPGLLRLLSIRLRAAGYEVNARESGIAALNELATFQPGVVVTDVKMDGLDGLALLQELHLRRPGLPVLLITAHGTIPDAVAATQSGAFDFLTKPVNSKLLLERIEKALSIWGGDGDQADEDWRSDIISRSPLMEALLSQARRIADADASVLITGDSGTGKELLARAIHRASARGGHEFVAINCGAIPEPLLESELFGHERGAFTGAVREHRGLFQAASNGTLFLDEIGDMPLALQVKLLRVLQEKCVRPVGSTETIPIDVRLISATHRDLRQALTAGEFREDLFYRLNVVNLHIPPLNQRREDIPLLVQQILARIAERNNGLHKTYAPAALDLLVAAEWPGNIRQLINVIEQNIALCPAPVIGLQFVEQALGPDAKQLPSLDEARNDFTRNYLCQLLQITGGNVSRAARLAKRNRTDFYKLLTKHQVPLANFKAD